MSEKYNGNNFNKTDGRRVDRNERRNAILDAAEQVFSRKDYHDATLDEIAQGVSLSKAALYLYFENKIDLFLSILERKLLQLVNITQKVVADCDNAVTAIKKIIVKELEFFRDNIEFFMIYRLQAKLSDDEIKERVLPIVQTKIDATAKCISRGQEDGVFQSVNPREAAFMLTALIHTCIFMRVATLDENTNLVDKAELVSKIFLDGLLVRE